VIIEELDFSNKGRNDASIMKQLVTAETARVRLMHTDPSYVRDFTNFCTTGNHIDSLVPADINSRRYEVYYSENRPYLQHEVFAGWMSKPADYFQWLFKNRESKKMSEEILKTFANFLYHVPLIGWQENVAKVSPLLAMNKRNRLDTVQQFVLHIIEMKTNWSEPDGHDVWKCDLAILGFKIYEIYKSWHVNTNPRTNDDKAQKVVQMKQFLQQLCYYTGATVVSAPNPFGQIVEGVQFLNLEATKKKFSEHFPGSDIFFSGKTLLQIREDRMKGVSIDELLHGYIPVEWRAPGNREEVNFNFTPTQTPDATPQFSITDFDTYLKSLEEK
jgi:hypothetical protein